MDSAWQFNTVLLNFCLFLIYKSLIVSLAVECKLIIKEEVSLLSSVIKGEALDLAGYPLLDISAR